SLTRLADDVGGLFRLLSFEQDPFDAENACGVADELLEALDALEAAGEPGKAQQDFQAALQRLAGLP
ncbi:SMI1/KNR4 family protein, partial [Pseudomonas aeruginosa]|nr:SMI1/KNR4 family protein [Pseudomonas aeruginosa]